MKFKAPAVESFQVHAEPCICRTTFCLMYHTVIDIQIFGSLEMLDSNLPENVMYISQLL